MSLLKIKQRLNIRLFIINWKCPQQNIRNLGQYSSPFCRLLPNPLMYAHMKLQCMAYEFSQYRSYAKRSQGKMLKSGKPKTSHLTDDEMADVIDVLEYRNELLKISEKLRKEFAENLSLRASVGNLTNIMVKVEDEEYPLNELAVISKKNPSLIAINMSNFPEAIKPALEAITESGSGMNAQQDGTMIYLAIPKLTRDHREKLAKSAKSLFTKAKDEIRFVQNDYIKQAKNQTELSEDLVFNVSNQIKAMADQSAEELEKLMKSKQKELLGDS